MFMAMKFVDIKLLYGIKDLIYIYIYIVVTIIILGVDFRGCSGMFIVM